MNRRRYLAGVGVGATGLTGCTDFFGPSEFQRRRVSLLRSDDFPADIPYSISFRVAEPTATPDHTVSFEGSLTNKSTETRRIEFSASFLDNLFHVRSSPPAYILMPEWWGMQDKRKQYCWEHDRDDDSAYGFHSAEDIYELAPGETSTGRIDLWNSKEADTCWPTGEFLLQETITIVQISSGESFNEVLFDTEWNFEFLVEKIY